MQSMLKKASLALLIAVSFSLTNGVANAQQASQESNPNDTFISLINVIREQKSGQTAETAKINEYSPLQLRRGTLVLRAWEDDKHYGDRDLVLKVTGKPQKIIKLASGSIYNLVGPYQLGENDIVGLNESSGGNASDFSTITILTIDKSGNMTPSRLDRKDTQLVSFGCDYLEEESTVVSATAVKFKCVTRDGRRTRSTFFTFENGRIKSSRQ